MRQVVLDTETTGLDPKQGHRIIEIGCVEIIDRKITEQVYHQYINPERTIDEGARAVHGISNAFVSDKPVFAQINADFLNFIKDSQLIIHNAPFDVSFINREFSLLRQKIGKVSQHCSVIDTLVMAREKHPGQKNNLDALCKRYDIDNTNRELHGALLDAKLLALVYLAMTGGQGSLFDDADRRADQSMKESPAVSLKKKISNPPEKVLQISIDEMRAHQAKLSELGADSKWG